MKKISIKKIPFEYVICIALVILTAVVIWYISSEETKSPYVSDKMKDLGGAALEITDDYLADKISVETAFMRLENNFKEQTRAKSDYFENDDSVYSATSSLVDSFKDKVSGTGRDEAIRQARDRLSKALR